MAEQEQNQELKDYGDEAPGSFFFVGWIAAVVIILALTAGLVMAREHWVTKRTSALQQQLTRGPRVLVTHVLTTPASRTIELPASIRGYIETSIYAKIPGYLKQIKVDKGDRVKRGQVLAILESPEIDHQVADAHASYRIAAITDRRNQALLKSGVIARQMADESHAAMLQAHATLRQLRATQAYEIIRAPYAGVITARYVDQGALIPQATAPSAAAVPIVAMATLRPLRVYAQVPQSVAPFIRDGDPATVTVAEYPRHEFHGSVTRHPDALNAATRTMLVEVDLPNQELQLYPGMYARVRFTVAMPAGVPMVPDDSLVFRNGKVYVPLVRNNHLKLAEVTLGYDNGQSVEIRSGVSPHDLVALDTGQAARDGEAVQPVLRDAAR